ncbi:Ceramidase family protein [Candida parapsilosis]|uniref:Uncharacterized protein n=2 Tax=Candida parapsilosis TaxID=5480 RepID=G8BH65_CANPC|nr:uncharacterized protein CPAR2_500150 [Candida parapsilosis]KAF6044398.1 Ceramidase family protein [Candida parapsilosis]KAF6045217.1 Ceramidase family protein [Candida parapsilosis]KAF6048638.1 Ceramidase family protein [Candida parapsilosis]KAF6060639.1 Ceramidase family protein [Candida parapsilosis]KAI5901082.1 Alkaline ceramidase YDC1 [Candida parapsilosis]
MLPFAWPYPPEQKNGYWGIPTSTIDWCEENYVVSTYIAEAINTTTNAFFMCLAVFAIYQAFHNHLEKRFMWTSAGFFLVGLGSWLFHMTLKYHFQLLDELPMIYTTCIPLWSIFSEFKTKRQSFFVGLSIFVSAATLTIIYLQIRNPTIHQTAYGAMNVLGIFKSTSLCSKYVHDPKVKRQMNMMAVLGIGLFFFGYILWNMDIHLCDQVRSTRRDWGMPYGFVLEGHGWWHIFTGSGVYYCLIYEEYLRCFLTGTEKYFTLSWILGWPVVTCIDPEGLRKYQAIKTLAEHDDRVKQQELKLKQQ